MLSRTMLSLTGGILGLWLLGGLVELATPLYPFYFTFRAFGLISPLVGFVCLALSLAALADAPSKWRALAAILLSVLIAVVPFFSLPYDPS